MIQYIKLIGSKGPNCIITKQAIKISSFIHQIHLKQPNNLQIHLPNIDHHSLFKIVQYCEHYIGKQPRSIPKPITSDTLIGIVDQWQHEFISVTPLELIQLTNASQKLQISSLHELCCAQISVIIKGMTPMQIQQAFQIYGYTFEQQERIRIQQEWRRGI